LSKPRRRAVCSVAAEEVRHDRNVGIASMVQAGKPKCGLNGFPQREAGVKRIAFHAIFALAVQFHCEDDVGSGPEAETHRWRC
jgi:hypothetical protein